MATYDYEKLEAMHPCTGCDHREYCDPSETPCGKYMDEKAAYLQELHNQGVPGY